MGVRNASQFQAFTPLAGATGGGRDLGRWALALGITKLRVRLWHWRATQQLLVLI